MGEKFIRTGGLVFMLFAIKLALYYIAVDISILSGMAYVVTLTLFGVSLILYRKGDDKIRQRMRWIYLIFGVLLCVDVVYYSYFNQVISVNQIFQIKNMKGTGESVKAAIPLVSLLLLADLPIMYFFRRKYGLEPSSDRELGKKGRLGITLGLLAIILLIALNPLRITFFKKLNNTEAVTTHVRDVVDSTVGKLIYDHRSLVQILAEKSVSSDIVEAELETDEPESPGEAAPRFAGIGEGMNLIVIQVESLQNFVINTSYYDQELTPFLNELLKKDTLYFNHYYTNMGKGNTADAEFSTQNSLYPVIEGACYDRYGDNQLLPLPKLLKEKGYATCSAVGDDADFYNRRTIYRNFGYDTFYSEENLNMDEISGLGLSDKSFFRQMAVNLSETDTPFFAWMLTVTNHYPYVLGEEIPSDIVLDPEDEGTLFGGYMQTVRYTDEAIEVLFEELKRSGLYENTIVAIYGDHHGLNKVDDANAASMEWLLGYPYDYDTMLNIPLIIHIPGLGTAETIEIVGGQVDFLPTIANLMNLDLSGALIFGQDLVNADEGFVATVAYMLQGSFIRDGILYEVGRDTTFESGRFLDLNTHQPIMIDSFSEEELDALLSDYEKAILYTESSKYALEHDLVCMDDETLEQFLGQIEEELAAAEGRSLPEETVDVETPESMTGSPVR